MGESPPSKTKSPAKMQGFQKNRPLKLQQERNFAAGETLNGPPNRVATRIATPGGRGSFGERAKDPLDGRLVAAARREPLRGDPGEPGPPPDVGVHLQDEGARLLAVRIPVYLHDPGRRVQDVELERVEHQVRPEPDVPA